MTCWSGGDNVTAQQVCAPIGCAAFAIARNGGWHCVKHVLISERLRKTNRPGIAQTNIGMSPVPSRGWPVDAERSEELRFNIQASDARKADVEQPAGPSSRLASKVSGAEP
jgi:hypothetical protein